jgi:hypothetical protein
LNGVNILEDPEMQYLKAFTDITATEEWFSSRFSCFRHHGEIWTYPDAVQLENLKLKVLVETDLSDLKI